MSALVVLLALILIPIGVAVIYFNSGRVVRDPAKAMKKLEGISDQKRLKACFRRWKNRELRQAVVDRLTPESVGELIGPGRCLLSEMLSYLPDSASQRRVIPYCPPEYHDLMRQKADDLFMTEIAASEDQAFLASVAMGQWDGKIRYAAAERLKDPQTIAEFMAACARRGDDEMFNRLLRRNAGLQGLPELLREKGLPDLYMLRVRQHIRCNGNHQFRVRTNAVTVSDKGELELGTVEHCRICGARAEHVQVNRRVSGFFTQARSGEALQEERRRLRVYRELANADARKLADMVTGKEAFELRYAAAERLTDVALILELLKRPDIGDGGLGGVLLWQLPFDFDFSAIAADPDYCVGLRRNAVSRIWDPDVLAKLSHLDALHNACVDQRFEAICPNGHDWKLEKEETVYNDEDDPGSIRWRVPRYRCTRCGMRREGKWVQF